MIEITQAWVSGWFIGMIAVVVGLIVIDLLWLIIRASWAWVDDADIKGNSIAKYYALYVWGTTEWQYSGDEEEYWVGMLVIAVLFVLVLSLLITFYLATAVLGMLVLIGSLTRFVRRLSKKFALHEKNPEAHK